MWFRNCSSMAYKMAVVTLAGDYSYQAFWKSTVPTSTLRSPSDLSLNISIPREHTFVLSAITAEISGKSSQIGPLERQ